MKRNIKSLKLTEVRTDGGTQSRVSIDQGAVDDYALALEEGAELPEPVVFFDGADNWLADGFHRLHANRKIGARAMDFDVRDGTLADAIFHAAGANKSHGLRRSNSDKRKAVLMLLQSPAHGALTNREISRQCGVSHPLVGQIRDELAQAAQAGKKAPPQQQETPAEQGGAGNSSTGPSAADTGGTVATPPDTSTQQPGPATVTKAQQPGESDDDGLGDFDPLDELERLTKELEGVRTDLTAASADDKAAEILKWRRIAETAQRRQNELMEQVTQREQELQWMSRALKQIGKAVGVTDPTKVLKAVENMAAQLAS